MAYLNQVIAIEKGVKSQVYSDMTNLNKMVQKPDLFNGFTRTYQAKEDAGEQLPSENKKVQLDSFDVLRNVQRVMSELMSVTARKDWTNCEAKGSVVIDGLTILIDVPITYLLFLEKQLNDIKTLITNIPVLDVAEVWQKIEGSSLYRTDPIETFRTKKVQKAIVLYDATDHHPAQTQLITEDVIVGYWKQTKQSGALTEEEKFGILERVNKLQQAVKEAREKANMQAETAVPNVGESVFSYLFEQA